MIEEYYASKRPPPVPKYNGSYRPPVVHTPVAPVVAHKQVASVFDTTRAAKMGLDIDTYLHRCGEVMRAQSDCRFTVGDTVWPVNEADMQQYGQCQVVGICRHYNDYGTVDWHEPPYILSIQSIKDRSEMLNTTANWVQRNKPEFQTENEGNC